MTAEPIANGGLRRRGVPLIGGTEKVTGGARYPADLDHAGALVGRILRSPVSHGEIIRLDVSRARALEGVEAIVTGDDCSLTYGVLPIAMNEYPRARRDVAARQQGRQSGTRSSSRVWRLARRFRGSGSRPSGEDQLRGSQPRP